MKYRWILLAWIIIVFTGSAGMAAPNTFLAEIDATSPWSRVAEDPEIRLLWQDGASMLLAVSEPALDRMDAAGVRAIALHAELTPDIQVFVLSRVNPDQPGAALEPDSRTFSGRTILFRDTGDPSPNSETLREFYIRLPRRGSSLDRQLTPSDSAMGSRDYDPLIQTMVDQVSSSTLYDIVEQLCSYNTRYSYSQGCEDAVNWSDGQLAGWGLTTEQFPHTTNMAPNLIATQPGLLNPDNIWIVCGHIDSTSPEASTLAPGADDNGTGSALTIHTAEILHNYYFEDTIIYALWTGEEQGLYGSSDWADWAADQGMNILGVFNFDMVGWVEPSPEDLNVIGNSASSAFCDDFIDALGLYTTLPTVKEIDGSMTYSDHAGFWSNGYHAFCAIEDNWPVYPYYHTVNDTIDKINFPFFTDCTKAALSGVATAAKPMPEEILLTDHSLDDSMGDDDGFADPGELVAITVELLNIRQQAVNGVTATLAAVTGQSYITIQDGTASFGDMAAMAAADNGGDPFDVQFSANTPENTEITFELSISGSGGYTTTQSFTMTVTAREYVCPIESWSMDTDPGWTGTGAWDWGQPTGQGGAYGGPDPSSGFTGSNVVGYNLNGDYTNSMQEYTLTAGPFDFTGIFDAELHFMRWLGVEQPQFDHARIQVSTNGSSYATVWENAGTIEDTAWESMVVPLGGTVNNASQVWIRWTMGPTDSGWTYCGWNIDDVELCGYQLGDPVITPTPAPTTPPTQAPTATPPMPPTPTTPPGEPTYTPVPTATATVNPSPTPTAPPGEPTYTPVQPTATPECSGLGVRVEMPAAYFQAGDPCGCSVFLCNPGPDTLQAVPLFVILDVYGSYFFAPGFSSYDHYLLDVVPGESELVVLPQFVWPSGAGAAADIHWYAAMTDAGVSRLNGEMGSFTFGWGN